MHSYQVRSLQAVINIEGDPFTMEADNGAVASIISAKLKIVYIPNLQKLSLQSTSAKLHTETIHILGDLSVKMECHGQNIVLPLLVVQEEGPG